MNFLEAVKAMEEGKIVYRIDGYNYRIKGTKMQFLMMKEWGDVNATLVSTLAKSDWQIVEEKKTLSSGLYNSESQYLGNGEGLDEMVVCSLTKLQEAIKEIKEHSNDNGWINISIEELKKIFGDRLV